MSTTNHTEGTRGIAYQELSELAVSDTDEAWLARTRVILFGFWFIALALVTLSATLAATAQSAMLTLTLGSLTAGSVLTAISLWAGNVGTARAGGWLFVISAAAAWLFGTAMMMEHSFGRTIIPLGKLSADANIPGRSPTRPIGRAAGMPGVRVGQ